MGPHINLSEIGRSSNTSKVAEEEMSTSFDKSSQNLRKVDVSNFKNCKRKVVESGLLEIYHPRDLVLWFENLPIWMLSLEVIYVKQIYFPQWESLSKLLIYLRKSRDGPLFEAVLSKFDQSLLIFKDISCCDFSTSLTLISGSLPFYTDSLHQFSSSQIIFVLDVHTKLRKIPAFTPRLFRIKHTDVGGATKFETVFSMLNIDKMPIFSKIQRDISSYIDYSIRTSTSVSDKTLFHLNQFDRLHPKMLHTKILVASDFSCSGFGLRRLSQEELGSIFGISTLFFDTLQHAEFAFVPVQVLRTLLSCGFDTVTQRPTKRSRLMLHVPQCSVDGAPIYLPALKRILPNTWAKCDEISQKAAKNDDAEIDFDKWDLRILSLWPRAKLLIPALRRCVLRYQFRKLFQEYTSYLRTTCGNVYKNWSCIRGNLYWELFHNQLKGVLNSDVFESFRCKSRIKMNEMSLNDKNKLNSLNRELILGRECLNSYLNTSFFGWDKGSTLLYWRWSNDVFKYAKSGFLPCILDQLPKSTKAVSTPKQPIFDKIYSKIKKALQRGYLKIESDHKNVMNVIDYFGVEKGESDIRVVFNGTSCGLNDAVWAPNFWLPTSKSMVRALNFNYKAVDIDLGEMFLNFPLHKKLITYSGVDLTPFKLRLKEENLAKNVSKN